MTPRYVISPLIESDNTTGGFSLRVVPHQPPEKWGTPAPLKPNGFMPRRCRAAIRKAIAALG